MNYEDLQQFKESIADPVMSKLFAVTEIPDGLCFINKLEIDFPDPRNSGIESRYAISGLKYVNGTVHEYSCEDIDLAGFEFVNAHKDCVFDIDGSLTIYSEFDETEIKSTIRNLDLFRPICPALFSRDDLTVADGSIEFEKMKYLLATKGNDSVIDLHLNHGTSHEGVFLRLPATPGEVGSAFALLDTLGEGEVIIFDVSCPIPNLKQYILNADISDNSTFKNLQALAQEIDGMDPKDRKIFSGALNNESINSLDDILLIAQRLDNYVLLPNINTDSDLGRFLVDTGFKDCPEDMQAYLNFAAIGRDYRSEHGGAFGSGGFVRRKSDVELNEACGTVITLHMSTAFTSNPYPLSLPATERQLNEALAQMNIDDFSEATIVSTGFTPACLADSIPTDCPCVEDANELALAIEHMMQTDGELLKYLSAIEVEQPQTMKQSYELAMNMDNYERVPDDAYEYGQLVLGRHGADSEILDVLDGYMDFEKFGEDAMKEDGVRRTEFGLIRRCDEPFPEQAMSQQMC